MARLTGRATRQTGARPKSQMARAPDHRRIPYWADVTSVPRAQSTVRSTPARKAHSSHPIIPTTDGRPHRSSSRTRGSEMGLILWPGDLDFWEQGQEYERRRLEEVRRRARLDAEWRLLQQHQWQPQGEERGHDDHAHEAHRAEGLAFNVGDAPRAVHRPMALPEDPIEHRGELCRN